MAFCTWHVSIFLSLSVLIIICLINNVNCQDAARPWYETLPAVAMDYKVHIDAGKEDCYWQYCQPGATFYVSFQVSLNFFLNYSKWSSIIIICSWLSLEDNKKICK